MLFGGSIVKQSNAIVDIIANNQVVAHFGGSYVKIGSNSAVLESRVFTLTNGIAEGQNIIVEFVGANAAKLAGTDKHLKDGDVLFLIWNGSAWKLIESYVKASKKLEDIIIFDDFLTQTPPSVLTTAVTGAGATGNITPPNDGADPAYNINGRVGFRQSATGTTATGRHSVITSQTTLFRFNTTPIFYESSHWFYTLPTALQDYVFTAGFLDNTAPASIVDGAFFRFGLSSPNLLAVTRSNSVETVVNTGVAVSATQWVRLKVEATNTQAKFYINNVLVQTISTNIPNTSLRVTGAGYSLQKTVGTTSIAMDSDFIKVYKELNR